ncbi:MAG: Rieske 2Fe-2S domain-containing protein [Gemmatimonadales bacterium]|nr:Rieske 2Fe-2S domain-containing protein [Gemmatimonadales bacterium]NIN10412.1 Rieske 2Fe-2S domain-containing protein [Gemmatimonadales bacterium]NIN49204.1 Rieske 2Fe-2S domain-containing protein [Gemmatimonadales bacterium]NIP06668.1 Rieske 2Fe-2S domain-containing protein [Gemmatimonadales bacterium]NIQ99998.1 Rieske 2Fe-2S domain-containing protein [Gemmatimonadales bacterium]
MSEAGFEKVAAIDDVPDSMPFSVQLTSGEDICLVKVNGEIFAFEDRCTHAEFPMSDGELVDDYIIECGLHGAQFDVRTGEAVELPATEELVTYEVKLQGGDVWLRVEG